MAMQPTSELSRKTLILLLILYGLSIVTSVIFLSHVIPTSKPLMTSIRPKNHPAVVYFYNQTTRATNITDGFIKFYDVRTNQKVEVLRIPNGRINEAQVSPDGQWVLFLTGGGRYGPYQLQRVRINGQQHETLYTFPPANYSGSYSSGVDDFPISVEWSFDQKSVLISTNINNLENTISSFDITTGVLRALLHIWSADYSYHTIKWLDKTHVYVLGLGFYRGGNVPTPPTKLYLMDVTTRQDPYVNDLKEILTNLQRGSGSFDSSSDGKNLFVVQEEEGNIIVWMEPATGGKRRIISRIANTPFHVITMRVSATSLLLTVYSGYNTNQVWRMGLDGSNYLVLFTSSDYTQHDLNRMTQSAWSNVSRDGKMFAMETENPDVGPPTLLVSPLSEGKPTKFEIFSYNATNDVDISFIVGWTTIG